MDNITKGVLCKLLVASFIAFLFLCGNLLFLKNFKFTYKCSKNRYYISSYKFNAPNYKGEVVGGLMSGSLAILSDAAHMFSDLSGFFISIFSVWVGTKPANKILSYGYARAEVIGAMASIVLIWGLTIMLLYEATHRIIVKEFVQDPLIMLITAGGGLLCNIAMAKVLHSGPGHHHHGGGSCPHSHGHSHKHGHDHGHGHGHDHEHGHDHDKHDHDEHDHDEHDHDEHDHHDHDHKKKDKEHKKDK
jgi:zinc transporter 2